MKSTAQRLGESYCKPQTEEEWEKIQALNDSRLIRPHLFPDICAAIDGKPSIKDRTLIPVSHFTDLMHDRIAPWRLNEDRFQQVTPYLQTRQYCFDFVTVTFEAENVHVTIPDRLGAFGIRRCKVTTYTQLRTLIEMTC